MEQDEGTPAPVRKRSGSSGRRRPRSGDGEAPAKKPRRGGLAAAIQKYIAVRPTDPLIQGILPKVEVPERPAAQAAAGTGSAAGATAGSAGSGSEHPQQHKATPPMSTPPQEERPVLPTVAQPGAAAASPGHARTLPGTVAAAKRDAVRPADKVPAAAARARPAGASRVGSAQPRRPAPAAAAGRLAAAAAALPATAVGATTSPAGKASRPGQQQAALGSVIASPPPAPPPPPSSAGGGLVRCSSESSTRIKLSLQQVKRAPSAAESLDTSAGAGRQGGSSRVRRGKEAQQAAAAAAQQEKQSRRRRSRPPAETFVLQPSRPPGSSPGERDSAEATHAVRLIARLFETTVTGGIMPAQLQQQQQQRRRPMLPVPIPVLPPGLPGLPPLSLQLHQTPLPLQKPIQLPPLPVPITLQQQQQQQQQQRRAPAVDPQLAQQALRALDETPQALMLGPTWAAALGSSPMLTPLALMLLDQGSSQPVPSAAGGSWAPALPAGGELRAGAAGGAGGAPVQTPSAALLAALLPAGAPVDDADAARLEEMLQRGDFSIESLLGSLPATPAPAAAVGPTAGTLPASASHALPSSSKSAASAAAGHVDWSMAAAAAFSPLLSLPVMAAATNTVIKPQPLAGAAWHRGRAQPAQEMAHQAQQRAIPAAELQRTPAASLLAPGGPSGLGLMPAGLGSPSQGLMSPTALADWLA